MNKAYIVAGIVILVIGAVLAGNFIRSDTLFIIQTEPTTDIKTLVFVGIIIMLIGIFTLIGGFIATDPKKKKWQLATGTMMYTLQQDSRACPLCRGPMHYTGKLTGWYCDRCRQYQKPQE